MRLIHAYRIHLALFVVGLIGYGAIIGDRLWRQSTDPHFVYQADAWLHGQVAIAPQPGKGDDWAKVETVVLRDGRTVRGRRFQTRPVFRTTDGRVVPVSDIVSSQGQTYFVSFPAVPTLIMMPAALAGGRRGNDVVPTLMCAALILPLAFATLRRLAAAGQSTRSEGDDLWLTLALAFGTVLYFASVQGRVWFTAHVVGVLLALGYAWASVEARRPIIAGVCLGLAAVTRAPMAFMFPLFLLEATRMAGGLARVRSDAAERRAFFHQIVKPVFLFAAPVVVIGIAAAAYNQVRFYEPTEFGH